MKTFLKYITSESKKEEGAIALMTMIFMASIAIASIVTLWSIANVTGAYNKLYIANQSSAYSALTTANSDASSLGISNQLTFNCGASYTGDGRCREGETFDVALEVLERSLNDGTAKNSFGLVYRGPGAAGNNVIPYTNGQSLTGGMITGVTVFELTNTPRRSERFCNLASGNGTTRFYTGPETNNSPQLACWRTNEPGIQVPFQYTTGVVTQAYAIIPKVPGIPALGYTDLNVQAAASLDQPAGSYAIYR